MDDGPYARLKLKGELTLVVGGEEIALTHVEFAEEKDLARLTLRGPLRELRKLDALGPAMAALLAHQKAEPGDRPALVRLLASAQLRADLAAARPDAAPEEWLKDARWAALAFGLERYVPEGVGMVTEEWER